MFSDVNFSIDTLKDSGATWFEVEGNGSKIPMRSFGEREATNEEVVQNFVEIYDRLYNGKYTVHFKKKASDHSSKLRFVFVKKDSTNEPQTAVSGVPQNSDLMEKYIAQKEANIEMKYQIEALKKDFENEKRFKALEDKIAANNSEGISGFSEQGVYGILDKADSLLTKIMLGVAAKANTQTTAKPPQQIQQKPQQNVPQNDSEPLDEKSKMFAENLQNLQQILGNDELLLLSEKLAKKAKENPEQFKQMAQML